MTDHPNIKRPMDTAPKDGTKFFNWQADDKLNLSPRVVSWKSDQWVAHGYTSLGIAYVPGKYWSPMPKEPEIEYCCSRLMKKLNSRIILKREDGVVVYVGEKNSAFQVDYCPWCESKLK